MENLYIAVFKITCDGVQVFKNEKIDVSYEYLYEGFEFKMLYADEKFFQMQVYAYNPDITMLLEASVQNNGIRVGGQYDTPMLIGTDGGFAGVLCAYIVTVSRIPVDSQAVMESNGFQEKEMMSAGNYHAIEGKLSHLERVAGFAELMNAIERDPDLRLRTNTMIHRTKVYQEAFVSDRHPCKTTMVSFQENLTLLAARESVKSGRHVAVLNFANPLEPGGGVLRGAKAQEENLCRCSNLYPALTSRNACTYYQVNNRIFSKNQYNSMFLGTDQVIYSPDVLVLKENTGYHPGGLGSGTEQYIEDPYCVDVITCAAPFFSGSGYILPNGDLQHLFEKRIRNILEAAIEHEVDVLILGAFGCGAFHNPPEIVADAFREVLLDDRYRKSFDQIIFAVKRTNAICPNIEAFAKNFSAFPGND